MRYIKFGIVGMGQQGRFYATLLKENVASVSGEQTPPEQCRLGGLCAKNADALEELKQVYPTIPCFTDYKELIDSGCCDAIIITVPHFLHHEITVYALTRGVSVLCEKPAGVRAKDVEIMNACAARHPESAFGMMLNQRVNPLYQQIKMILESGELGEIRRVNWIVNTWWRPDSYYESSPWRGTWGGEGGGLLVNQATHQLDLWLWLCGKPVKVYAKCIEGAHRSIEVDNDVTIVAEYANGATGCFVSCTHDPFGTDRLEIDLSNGKILVENGQAAIYKFIVSEKTMNCSWTVRDYQSALRAPGGLYEVRYISGENTQSNPYVRMMENFAQHIINGTPLVAKGNEGIISVQLANTAQLSSWIGKELVFPCDPEQYAEELNKRIAHENKYPIRK